MDWLHTLVDWYLAHIDYLTIFLLMALESSFIPFPSEVVVPPAAWLAAEGRLDFSLVVVAATCGALVGAVLNYVLGAWLGRPLVYRLARTRLARFLLVDEAAVAKSEEFFRRHGVSATLVGRLVPVVRQLISLPAGFARMAWPQFLAFTAIGAGLWNLALAALGYFLFSQKALLEQYYGVLVWIGLGLGLTFVGFLVWSGLRKPKVSNPDKTQEAP